MTTGSHTTADGITSRPSYDYDAPQSFFNENAAPTGAGVYNVKDFGAVASASVDNRAAIQAAVDAAAEAGGGVVYIPDGVYGVGFDPDGEGAIKIKDNVFIKGGGMGETVLRVLDNVGEKITGIIRSPFGEETKNFGISDLTLDGNRENNPESSGETADLRVDGFFCGGMPDGDVTVSDVTLLRVEIANCSGYGFDPHERTQRLLIEDSVAHHNGKDGFVADYVVDGEYRGNLAYENGRHGFNITTSTRDFLLEDNIARDNGGTGVDVQRGSYDIPPPDNIVIRGNVFENNARDGVLLQMTGNVLVEDNLITGSGRSGVRVFGAHDVTLRGNTIVDSSQNLTNGYADIQIREYDDTLGVSSKLWDARNVLVEGNRIVADGEVRSSIGIEEQSGATGGSLIRDNEIHGQQRETFSIEDSDTRVVHAGSAQGEVIAGAKANDALRGMGGDDKLQGYAGDDRLEGGQGADKLYGGAGDDLYFVDNTNDSVKELEGEGNDTVHSSATFAIKANVERLILTGLGSINGKGNLGDNYILGNAANNLLEGGAGDDKLFGAAGADELKGGDGGDLMNGGLGADKMSGGLGDDRYMASDAGDKITEAADGGKDVVYASAYHELSANVEVLVLTGNAGIAGAGNDGDNILAGNAAANTLNGNGGDDLLVDGAGADTLNGGEGRDRFSLASDGANDIVSGGGGADDTLILNRAAGGMTIAFTAAGDGSVQGGGMGFDRFTGIEAVTAGMFADTLTGSSAGEIIHLLDGNDVANGGGGDDSIVGGDGNDNLTDGAGSDRLNGGGGSDVLTLAADNALDTVWGGAGTDMINLAHATGGVSVSFGVKAYAGAVNGGGMGVTKFAEVEKVAATRFADRVSGGAGAETFVLGAGDDVATAGAGNDTLWAGRGDDKLAGGLGGDVFAFSRGDFAAGERDTIDDFHIRAGDRDTLRLEGAASQYAFANIAGGAVTVTHLASGGVVEIENFTVAQLAGNVMYF